MANEMAELIKDARNLRDYALISGTVKSDDLVKSLTPFELNPADPDPDPEQLKQLQVDMAAVARSIDPDTRYRVLMGDYRRTSSGRFPQSAVRYLYDFWISAVLIVVGVTTLCLLSSYSMLAVSSSLWLSELRQRGTVDYVSEMNNLFAVIARNDDTVAGRETVVPVSGEAQPPALATYDFLSRVSKLKAMIARDSTLQNDAYELEVKYYWCRIGGGDFPQVQRFVNIVLSASCEVRVPGSNSRNEVKASISRTTTPVEANAMSGVFDQVLRQVENTKKELLSAVDETRGSANYAAQQVEIARQSWRSTSKLMFNMVATPNRFPERDEIIAAGITAYSQETSHQWLAGLNALEVLERRIDPRTYDTILAAYSKKVQRFLDTINGWILPTLYGALGAIVLCLTRTASRFYATPSLARIAARLAVAMLGGALISIIFAPSYFSEGVKANSSFVFLLCFIFGYSTSAFVTLLDNIATKLAGTKV